MTRDKKRLEILLPTALIALIALTYGLPAILGWFGFYGDDWIYIYNHHLMGAGSFGDFVRWDRPFSAWIYVLSAGLFGTDTLPYHLMILTQRVVAALFFLFILKILFPSAQRTVYAAAMIFAFYPGFRQQPVAVQFILHFAAMNLSLVSIWLMLTVVRGREAAREKQLPKGKAFGLTLLSAALAALGLFSCEYFTGWELTRPILIWVLLSASESTPLPLGKRAAATLKYWFPYLISLAAFLFWRVFIFAFQTYQPKLLNDIGQDPVKGILTFAKRIAGDLSVVTLEAYRLTLKQPADPARRLILSVILAAALTLLILLFSSRNDGPAKKESGLRNEPAFAMIAVGAAALLSAGIPFWATLLPIEIAFPWDRSTLPFAFGAALLSAGLVSALFRDNAAPFIFALMVALSIGAHAHNAFIYRDESAKLNDYFWQMAWRVPGLKPGTTIVSAEIPLDRTSDNDLTPIVNWQYAPELRGSSYAYKYFDLHLRYEPFFADATENEPFDHDYRSHRFHGNTGQILALTYRENGCLWTLSDTERDFPGIDADLAALVPRSDLNLIDLEPDSAARPPKAIGAEPERGYCYDFQRLRIAQQADDLAAAENAARSILGNALKPSDPFDYIPVVTALAALGDSAASIEAARFVLSHEGNRAFLCAQLGRRLYSGENDSVRDSVRNAVGCD